MQIVKAVQNDLKTIVSLFEACKSNLAEKEIYQWNTCYPNEDVIANDIRSGCMHLIRENADITGAITLNEDQPEEYMRVMWTTDGKRVLVVHRLAVHPDYQGRGAGTRLMTFAEEFARKEGYVAIRLEAYSANPSALKLYERLGYRRTGQINFPMRELPFICFEKGMAEGE